MLNIYITFATFRFPSQNKVAAFISMMSSTLWQEKSEKETKSIYIYYEKKYYLFYDTNISFYIDFTMYSLFSKYVPLRLYIINYSRCFLGWGHHKMITSSSFYHKYYLKNDDLPLLINHSRVYL